MYTGSGRPAYVHVAVLFNARSSAMVRLHSSAIYRTSRLKKTRKNLASS